MGSGTFSCILRFVLGLVLQWLDCRVPVRSSDPEGMFPSTSRSYGPVLVSCGRLGFSVLTRKFKGFFGMS